MKPKSFAVALLSCGALFAQTSDLFDKAPPEIDEALRARVHIFYQAHITGKYSQALAVVAPDAQDDFLAAGQDQYKGCEINRINYAEQFTKAAVVSACKGEFRWRGRVMPVTMPLVSNWKFVDGKWWWYHVVPDEIVTPFGVYHPKAAADGDASPPPVPVLPADPAEVARNILTKVSIDKNSLELKGYEASSGEIHVLNQMPGSISITVDPLPTPGTHIKVEPADIPAGGKATITISYDPADPAVTCYDCVVKAALPTLTTNVRVAPSSQVFPVTVSFAVSPEVLKKLPKIPPQQQKP